MLTQNSRTRQIFTLAILPALLALTPAAALANGTRLPNQDAEATARGNAFVATADNPSAIYYNPAGLTQLSGLQVLAESYSIFVQNDYTPSTGGARVEATRKVAVVPQFYVAYTPEKSPVSYGLGVYSPFGQSTDWPDSSGFRTTATYNKILFITMAPTIAWKLSEHLSVGAGLQVNQVHADLRRGIGIVPNDEFRFNGDDTSLGYNLGVMWHINDHHVIGLNYQSGSTSRFKGTETLSPFGLSAPANIDLPFPDVITLGYSWRPTKAWNLEVAVDRTNWEVLNTATLHSSLVTTSIPFDWKPSYYYLFGVTRYLSDGWRISAGYAYSENSVPDATFNPAVPDMARQLASIGVGRTFGAISCYLTYQHSFENSRDVSGASSAGGGHYRSTLDALALSFGYAF